MPPLAPPRTAPRRRIDGVLLLDKPGGITSNAALQTVRRLFNAAKGGHTGTLDPLATGLLPLCLGEATKFAGTLLHAEKTYEAVMRLGVVTDTADAQGKVIDARPVCVSLSDIDAVLPAFLGTIMQTPPMYSALKREGKPLYAYAREGITLDIAPRPVCIHALAVSAFDALKAELAFTVHCSHGAYIRTLAADMGEALGCGAHLCALRRTRVGHLSLAQAYSLDALAQEASRSLDRYLLPPDALLVELARLDLDVRQSAQIMQGRTVMVATPLQGRLRLYGAQGDFLGLGDGDGRGGVKPVRLCATGVSHEAGE
jgi:tRNA pseudouridine55 synthase